MTDELILWAGFVGIRAGIISATSATGWLFGDFRVGFAAGAAIVIALTLLALLPSPEDE